MNSCCEFRAKERGKTQTYAIVYFRNSEPTYLILASGNAYRLADLPREIPEEMTSAEEVLSDRIESGDIVFEIWCTSRSEANARLEWVRDSRVSIYYYLLSVQSPPLPPPLFADWSTVRINRSNDPFPAELLDLLRKDPAVSPFLPEIEYSGVYCAELAADRSSIKIDKNPALPANIRNYGKWITANHAQSSYRVLTLYRLEPGPVMGKESAGELITNLLNHLFQFHGTVWAGKKIDITPGHYPRLYDWSRAIHSASPAEWSSYLPPDQSFEPKDLPRMVLNSIRERIASMFDNFIAQ